MGVLRLKGYKCDAEILGSLREVEVDEGVFIVRGVSLYECNRLLHVLSTGKIQGIQPGDGSEVDAAREILSTVERVSESPDAPAQAAVAPASKPQQEQSPQEPPQEAQSAAEGGGKPPRKRRTKAEMEAAKAAASNSGDTGVEESTSTSAEVADAPEETDMETETANAAAAQKAAAETKKSTASKSDGKAKSNGATAASKSGDNTELIASLKDLRKLRDVLGVLVDAGYKTQDALVTKCTEIKDNVPVLDRCLNIPERVSRIAESIGVPTE